MRENDIRSIVCHIDHLEMLLKARRIKPTFWDDDIRAIRDGMIAKEIEEKTR